jgi:two-component system sensor histidine kinase KdpD
MDRIIIKMWSTIPAVFKDFFKTGFILLIAYITGDMLQNYIGANNNVALIFTLAVAIVSRVTEGYFFGIAASVISVFLINYAFMYPYYDLNFTLAGYPVALLSMLAVSVTICALTTQIKKQKEQAVERERLNKQLYEMNERLAQEQAVIKMEREKEKIRSNMLRAISHDLRTPLTSILGASSVLLEKGLDFDKESIRLIENIKEDSEWLIRMIENLLSVTKIYAEAEGLVKKMESVEEIVEEAVTKTKKRFPRQRITVEVPAENLEAPIDALLIEQVAINLLENAIRHSGDKENIKLKVYSDNSYAIFEVSDRGKGITRDTIDNIVKEYDFARSNSADSTRGAGIGLSVCQSIIKAHGGFFEAMNNQDGGATFRFGLPLKE